jgi:NAD(P)-dependent dehydrogenase (short-subunit alcohol dehydrogenase family)
MPAGKPQMKNRTVLITGATSGIGKATAIGLAKAGATIVFTSRNVEKGKSARDEIEKTSGNSGIHMMQCDLSSLESVRSFCKEFIAHHPALHVLINNAGVWDFKRRESQDGIENILAVNLFAPFLLTNLLLDHLKKSAPARIINVSSGLHFGTMNFNDIEFKRKFSGFNAYRQSKLGIILFTRLLSKKLEGTGVTVNAVHPGMVSTDLGRDAGLVTGWIFKLMGKSSEQGAATSIYLAGSPEAETVTGEYFTNCKPGKASNQSHDMAAAEKLWNIAAEYVQL